MPCDYSKYPKNWKTEIRPRILARADNKCEQKGCGAVNHSWGYHGNDEVFYTVKQITDTLEDTGRDMFDKGDVLEGVGIEKKPKKIVLTIAHLDHNVANNEDSNLKALCQRHHLALDKQQHTKNARETNRKKKGLQNLFVNMGIQYSKENGIAVVEFLKRNGFKAELIGSLAKIGFSIHDIDIHVMDSGTREDRDKLKQLLITSEVDETDWGGLYFKDTQFGDVDIFFSLDGFDY